MNRQLYASIPPAILLALSFVIGLSVPGEFVSKRLSLAARDFHDYSLFVHAVFAVVLVVGWASPRWRNPLFAALMAYLSGSALTVAILYRLVPNVLVFGLILVMIGLASWKGQ